MSASYLIKATSNEVQTFVDTAVFDAKTARLLFRAPGLDKSSDRSTLIESNEVVRKTKDASFAAAMGTMTQNLAMELDRFRERVRKKILTVAAVEWKPGYGGGGGAFSLWIASGVDDRCRSACPCARLSAVAVFLQVCEAIKRVQRLSRSQ